MAASMEGMSTTTSGGSPLAQGIGKRKKRGDVENAADARQPGDMAEDSPKGRKAARAMALRNLTKRK